MLKAQSVDEAKEHFGRLIETQLARVDRITKEKDWVDYQALPQIVIGVLGGDGIGPAISAEAQRILEHLLDAEVRSGKVRFRTIEGLTIENRARVMKAIPNAVLAEIRECHVTLKGPTTTPEQGDEWPNLESAKRGPCAKSWTSSPTCGPVRVPAEGIDWTFYRENHRGPVRRRQ